MNSSSKWLIGFIIFYGIQAVFALFVSWFPPWTDPAGVVLVLTVLLIIDRYIKMPVAAAVFFGISFIPHIFGLYQAIPISATQTTTLYGAPQLDYHYDWIVHTFAMFCISTAFCAMTYRYFMKGFNSKMLMFVIVLFFVVGIGSLNEILEYVGYDTLGYGRGFLEMGEGDYATNNGPWQNSSLDQFNNLLGALLGTGLFLLSRRNPPRQL